MLVYKSLSPSVEFTISLFPVYLQQADVLDLLIGFFLTLFDSLKSQVNNYNPAILITTNCINFAIVSCILLGRFLLRLHDSSRLSLIWMGLLTFTHVCVDSS